MAEEYPKPLLEESDNIIITVGNVVDRNSFINSSSSHIIGDKARKTWKRLTWDSKDVQELRSRAALNVTFLGSFIGSLTRCENAMNFDKNRNLTASSKVALATKDSVDILHERHDIRARSEEHVQILSWLSSIDFAFQQIDHLKRRQPGTGRWILDSSMFQTWLKTPGKTLFCPGIPGADKTVLTAIVVGHLLDMYQSEPAVGIEYIYFNYQQQIEQQRDEQSLDNLLGSLLSQLSGTQHSISKITMELYERH